jgi:uncharacterized protein
MREGAKAAPVTRGERIGDIDVLRGTALFGVFLVNMIGIANAGLLATEAQLAALRTAGVDRVVTFMMDWLVEDKANTVFAFLFGLGFYIQMERGLARDARFGRVYARRLAILALFGWAHMLFLWTWDILHLYGMVGFALLALRRVPDRVLLAMAVPLLALDFNALEWALSAAAIDLSGGVDSASDAEVLARQAAVRGSSYAASFAAMWRWTWYDYLINGQLVAWMVYALGRFAFGAWIGRKGWIRDADALLPAYRRVFRLCLPLGLTLSLLARLLEGRLLGAALATDAMESLGASLRPLSAAILATGYVSGVVLALRTSVGRRIFAPLRAVGQTALTNYVAQSFVYAFVLFGMPPGLGLAGRIGSTALFAVVVGIFAGQVALSNWWLGRFDYGPLEWAWRALTYGRMPPIRRAALDDAQPGALSAAR